MGSSAVETSVVGILMIGAVVTVAVLGMHWVRRRLTHPVLKENDEVAGFIVGVLGMVYALLLALVVVVVWEMARDAEERVDQEANCVSSLRSIGETLSEPMRGEIHRGLERYVRAVVDDEWFAMAEGETSTRARDAYHVLWRIAASPTPLATPQQVECYSQFLDQVQELGSARRLRLLSNDARLPPVMWVLLVFGAVLNIGFTFLFGATNARRQAVMTGALAAMIGATLFLIVVLEHPFRGLAAVTPEVYEQLWERADVERSDVRVPLP